MEDFMGGQALIGGDGSSRRFCIDSSKNTLTMTSSPQSAGWRGSMNMTATRHEALLKGYRAAIQSTGKILEHHVANAVSPPAAGRMGG
jgi:hypothetical protein